MCVLLQWFHHLLHSHFNFTAQAIKKYRANWRNNFYERMMANETHLPQSNDELLFKSQTELLSLSHVHIAEQPIKLFSPYLFLSISLQMNCFQNRFFVILMVFCGIILLHIDMQRFVILLILYWSIFPARKCELLRHCHRHE